MPKNEKEVDKGNLYDRIFRENVQDIFLPLIEMELGLKFKSYKVLQEKIAKTLEREVDFLCEIITEDDNKELLHIEFQTKNDGEMIYRMQEYHGLIYRKYKLPIHHVVVYLGESKTKMVSSLSDEGVFTGFSLICVNELDTERLLSKQVPEIVIMALLSNYKKEQVESVLRLILNKLEKIPKSKNASGRYINQLLLLSKLCNLEKKIIKTLEDMPVLLDINDSVLFKRGKLEGKTEAIIGFYKEGVAIEIIAKSLSISEKRVLEIIDEWKNNVSK